MMETVAAQLKEDRRRADQMFHAALVVIVVLGAALAFAVSRCT